jgi:hypothetical protein
MQLKYIMKLTATITKRKSVQIGSSYNGTSKLEGIELK